MGYDIDGIPIENTEFYNGQQDYSFQITIRDWSDTLGLQLDFDYKINEYTPEKVQKMYRQFELLIDKILTTTEQTLSDFCLLSPEEKQQKIYENNNTKEPYPQNDCIHHLFEEQVRKTPEKTAIEFNSQSLTYSELNRKANGLAQYLRKKGLSSNKIVGLLVGHSIEAAIGILGILKAGRISFANKKEDKESAL